MSLYHRCLSVARVTIQLFGGEESFSFNLASREKRTDTTRLFWITGIVQRWGGPEYSAQQERSNSRVLDVR